DLTAIARCLPPPQQPAQRGVQPCCGCREMALDRLLSRQAPSRTAASPEPLGPAALSATAPRAAFTDEMGAKLPTLPRPTDRAQRIFPRAGALCIHHKPQLARHGDCS